MSMDKQWRTYVLCVLVLAHFLHGGYSSHRYFLPTMKRVHSQHTANDWEHTTSLGTAWCQLERGYRLTPTYLWRVLILNGVLTLRQKHFSRCSFCLHSMLLNFRYMFDLRLLHRRWLRLSQNVLLVGLVQEPLQAIPLIYSFGLRNRWISTNQAKSPMIDWPTWFEAAPLGNGKHPLWHYLWTQIDHARSIYDCSVFCLNV